MRNQISILKNGAYAIEGNIPLEEESIVSDGSGVSYEWKKKKTYPKQETYLLCRCGKSKNKPYCDSSHIKAGFNGTETASKKPFVKQAKKYVGPGIDLLDVYDLCSISRFCDRFEGIWKLTKKSDNNKNKKEVTRQACNCPSGRLVAIDKKTGKAIEPALRKSISITQDPQKNCSGPLWVKGGIQIKSSSGLYYETRNRVALCRCGKSQNKPFCDGTHIETEFKDK